MPITISQNGQTRCRNSYASSAQARLSLRVNGEQTAAVITDAGSIVPAGFDAPTVLPTVGTNGAGNVPVGFYVYRYVYVSSRYPFVANDITVDGKEWPRSNPSPASATYQVTPAAESNAVTVTYSTRTDVDWIALYRTPNGQTTAALAEAFDAAGELYFVEMVANNSAGGTTVITDNNATNSGERMEADNFPCPLFRQTVFDGFYFWGWGNRTLEVAVTLDGTGTVTLDTVISDVDSWFSGRDTTPAGLNGGTNPGPTSVSFLGITTGGYDGRGNFYLRVTSPTTLSVYNAAAMLTPTAIPATGTTTAYLTAPSATLYRSKVLNPFSWGETERQSLSPQPGYRFVPLLYAKAIGGGVGTAISLIANERILKLDTEAPERSYALDLNAADSSDFLLTLRTLDTAQSVGSQFSQFPMRLENGQSVSGGINAKSLSLVSADAQSQVPIGDEAFETLHKMRKEDGEAPFFHGVYDRGADLNCWFIKTTDSPYRCDTLIYQHAPTGTWGIKYTPGVSASWTVYDDVTENFWTFVGTETGLLGIAFYPDKYRDWITDHLTAPRGTLITDGGGPLSVEIPILNTIVSIFGSGGTYTVETGETVAVETGDIVLLSQTAGFGHAVAVTVLDVPFSNEFRFSYLDIGSISYSGGAVVDAFTLVPSVAFFSTENKLYLLPELEAVTFVGVLDGVAGYSAVAGNTTPVFNLNTGLYQDAATFATGDSYTAYWGCIPSFLTRWFNASSPQKNKKNVEIWATQQDLDTTTNAQWLKFLIEYRAATPDSPTTTGALVRMTRDKVGTGDLYGDSDSYYYKTPIDAQAHAYGLGFLELGYERWRLLDFTFKQQQT